jgi:hypothetical protein
MYRHASVVSFILWAAFPVAHAQATEGVPIDGSDDACSNFKLRLLNLGFTSIEFEIADEGWVWVQRSQPGAARFRSVSGVVAHSRVARNDTPANHDSHDQNANILVDPGQEEVLSDVNAPNNEADDDLDDPDDAGQTVPPTIIEMEWETGIRPSEKSGDGSSPYFPKWAWPSEGDRIWTDGHWVLDCGHIKRLGRFVANPVPGGPPIFVAEDHFRSEIHPARAIASMRRQARTLPGSGATPAPVTAVDLYIHGRGGFVTDILNCGMNIMVDGADEDGDGDGDGDPTACPVQTSPIDVNFSEHFDICLPPKPHPNAILVTSVEDGPGNTLSVVPNLSPQSPAAVGCGNDGIDGVDLYDLSTSIHVTVPLAGSGAQPTDVYARRIHAGWVFPPDPPLDRMQVRLDKMDLHDDHEFAGSDAELTFFWINVDRAANEWTRIVDFEIPTSDDSGFFCGEDHTNRMDDYDADGGCGNGELNFSGPVLDFFVPSNEAFRIRSVGYEQDCYEGSFGDHDFDIGVYVFCHSVEPTGNNDAVASLDDAFMSSGFAPGVPESRRVSAGDEYDLFLTMEKRSAGDEDRADLVLTKTCTPAGEVAIAGEPVDCVITVSNPGPGLPRNVRVTDTLTGGAAGTFAVGAPAVTLSNGAAGAPCSPVTTTGFECDLGTVPVGGTITIQTTVLAQTPQDLTNTAAVTSASDDPNAQNNEAAADVRFFQLVQIDILPGRDPNPLYVGRGGLVPVGVPTTPDLDATTIDPSTLCFGDAQQPPQRDCTESHGTGHFADIDRDRVTDLLMHFDAMETGIDEGDSEACLIGYTVSGTGIYGCDSIRTTGDGTK